MWFPMMVGSDETAYAWMDEGVNTFITIFAAEDYYPESTERAEVRGAYEQYTAGSSVQGLSLMTPPDAIAAAGGSVGILGYRHPASALLALRPALAPANVALVLVAAVAGEGIRVESVDIGGGFPARYDRPVPALAEFGRVVTKKIAELPYPVEVVAEPGRCLVAEAGTLRCRVIGVARRGAPRGRDPRRRDHARRAGPGHRTADPPPASVPPRAGAVRRGRVSGAGRGTGRSSGRAAARSGAGCRRSPPGPRRAEWAAPA